MPESRIASGKLGRPDSSAPASTPGLQQDIGKIRAHYVWLTVLTGTLTCALVVTITAYFSERLHQEGRVRVAALAATIAGGIPADELLALGSRRDETSPQYRELCARLIAARQANPEVRRIFVLTPGPHSKIWRFALDAVSDRSEGIHRGDLFNAAARPQVQHGMSGPTADPGPFEDRRGSWLGGTRLFLDQVIVMTALDFRRVGSTRFIAQLKRDLLRPSVDQLLGFHGITAVAELKQDVWVKIAHDNRVSTASQPWPN